MYAEIFSTLSGYERVVWASRDAARGKDKSKALRWETVCTCCVESGLEERDCQLGDHAAVYVDTEGYMVGDITQVCEDCLRESSETGPGYRAPEEYTDAQGRVYLAY